MKAYFLVKNGAADRAFELRETQIPEPKEQEVQIKVEAFGLNFADVMARKNLYPDAPPKPAILGYDVVGVVSALGKGVTGFTIGQRVLALTRFGGYAEYVTTQYQGVVPIGEDMSAGTAVALATQAGTAVYMFEDLVKPYAGDHVLIHSGAGGVGNILIQLALNAGCTVYSTAGSDRKVAKLREQGVHEVINYSQQDFQAEVRKKFQASGRNGLDIVFDAVGGSSVKKDFKLLDAGGRLVLYGAAAFTSAGSIFSKIGTLLGFGFYHPLALMNPSKAILGVNMLQISDSRPEILSRVLNRSVQLAAKGIINPQVAGVFPHAELAKAHEMLGERKTTGKIAIIW